MGCSLYVRRQSVSIKPPVDQIANANYGAGVAMTH